MANYSKLCSRASLPWCAIENGLADVSSVVPSGLRLEEVVGPYGQEGQDSLLARLWPATFALRQGKLLYRAHSRCPSYNQRLRLHGKVHLTGALPYQPGYFVNHLLRPRIWPSFLASSGVGPCDVPFRYASEPTPCGCQVARPPRLSEQARDGGQARPSSRSRDSNS